MLKVGDKGIEVSKLQKLLRVKTDGVFGPVTKAAVIRFQMYKDLTSDGIVGNDTWLSLFANVNMVVEAIDEDSDISSQFFSTDFDQRILKYYLPSNEYVHLNYKNGYMFLHHTAGREDPLKVIDSWSRDSRGRVGTEFVLGGRSHTTSDDYSDGLMVQAFPENNLAWHLGKTGSGMMNKSAVGLEICSMGYLDEGYKTYVGSTASKHEVIKLKEPFKGKLFWHKYSTMQIEQTEKLIKYVEQRDQIDMRLGLKQWIKKYGPYKAFDFHQDAYLGKVRGLLTHANVRRDKTDCYPDPDLVDMIMSL